MRRSAILSLLLILLSAPAALAQRDRLLVEPSPPAEWGVTFSFLPTWDFRPVELSELAGADPENITGADGRTTLKGSTWSIGFARGRALGAEWGVSFVQQRIRKGSVIDRVYRYECLPGIPCAQGERLTLSDVTVIGPEVHFYIPFATIRDRVQFGVILAGGAGAFRGTGIEDRIQTNCCVAPITTDQTRLEGDITEITNKIYFGDVHYTFFGRGEPGVAVIASPRVRFFAGAGFHYPATTYFSVRATYFFTRSVP